MARAIDLLLGDTSTTGDGSYGGSNNGGDNSSRAHAIPDIVVPGTVRPGRTTARANGGAATG